MATTLDGSYHPLMVMAGIFGGLVIVVVLLIMAGVLIGTLTARRKD